jgi:hypothetical protein
MVDSDKVQKAVSAELCFGGPNAESLVKKMFFLSLKFGGRHQPIGPLLFAYFRL